MDLNKVMIIGRTTTDIELKQTPTSSDVCSFSIATNKSWTDRETGEVHEKVEFHNIVLWGKKAEVASKYVRKGDKIFIEGSLETQSWEKDGVKKYKTNIIGDKMIMLQSKRKKKQDDTKEIKDTKNDSYHASHDEIGIEDLPF